MKRIFIFLTLLVAFATANRVAADEQPKEAVAVFTVAPAMHCQNCENKIKTNLRHERGVVDIKTDLKAQTVTIKYKPQATDAAKLADALKKLGYTATEGTAAKTCTGSCGQCGKENGKCCGKK